MKQMITRLDDELHASLKQRAAIEGRSVNDLVIEALAVALGHRSKRQSLRDRARATGRLVVPEPPVEAPSREEVLAATRGVGDAVSSALTAERAER